MEFICEPTWSRTVVRGKFFVFLTDSISSLVISLFIFFISSWLRLGECTFLGIFSLLLGCQFYWHIIALAISYNPSYFCVVRYYFSSISHFIDFSLLFSWWVWLKVYQLHLSFKALGFTDHFYLFLVSILLIYAVIFISFYVFMYLYLPF